MGIKERVDRITNIPEPFRTDILPPPLSAKIELTGRCNFKCKFCAKSQNLRELGEMDWNLYARLCMEMHSAGVEELGLFYLGESFMVKWLAKAVQHAKNTGFEYVFLTSNGSLAFPQRVKGVLEAGLDSLKWSLNYSDADQFQQIAGVKPAIYQQILDNIKSAWHIRREGGYPCRLYASYINYDGEQGERMRGVISDIEGYVDDVYALPLYSQASLIGSEGDSWKPTPGNIGRADNPRPPLPCWAVSREAHITYDGMLSACCFGHEEKFTMGDLNNTRFMQAWNSDKFRELRAAHLAKDVTGTCCENCIAYG